MKMPDMPLNNAADLACFARALANAIVAREVPLHNASVPLFLEAFAGALEDSAFARAPEVQNLSGAALIQHIADALDSALVYD